MSLTLKISLKNDFINVSLFLTGCSGSVTEVNMLADKLFFLEFMRHSVHSHVRNVEGRLCKRQGYYQNSHESSTYCSARIGYPLNQTLVFVYLSNIVLRFESSDGSSVLFIRCWAISILG